LRRAEALSEEPGQLAVLKRVRKECSFHCVTLANAIRALQGRPTDLPSARFSLKLADENLGEAIDLVQSAQQHIIAAITALIDEPGLAASRSALAQVLRLHQDDVRWLKSLLAR
jgi:hypothetical protein